MLRNNTPLAYCQAPAAQCCWAGASSTVALQAASGQGLCLGGSPRAPQLPWLFSPKRSKQWFLHPSIDTGVLSSDGLLAAVVGGCKVHSAQPWAQLCVGNVNLGMEGNVLGLQRSILSPPVPAQISCCCTAAPCPCSTAAPSRRGRSPAEEHSEVSAGPWAEPHSPGHSPVPLR